VTDATAAAPVGCVEEDAVADAGLLGAVAFGAVAFGAVAFGAVAFGAVAFGAVALDAVGPDVPSRGGTTPGASPVGPLCDGGPPPPSLPPSLTSLSR
jgi:hypothetical protein